MRKLIAAICCLLLSVSLFGQVPKTLSYQGVLIDNSNGQAVADGNYTFQLALYDAQTGGTLVWSETQSSVAVSEGIYNIILGSVTPLNINFDKTYYLQVTISGGPSSISAETLTPRAELTASGYELNQNLQDLADGSLSGSKVGTGINASNITTGTLPLGRLTGITTSQLSASANITGSQLSSSAGIASGQITSLDASKVSGITSNYIPRSNGSGFISGEIRDFGTYLGIGTSGYSGYFVNIYTANESIGINTQNQTSGSVTIGMAASASNGTIESIGLQGTASGSSSAAVYGIFASASGGTTNYAGYFSGSVYTTGSYNSSDIRLKKDISTITDPIHKISQLNGIYFKWKSADELKKLNVGLNDSIINAYNFDKVKHVGLIAQEVEKVLPEVVMTDQNGFKMVDYAKLVPLLVEGIKQQQTLIQDQSSEIEKLKSDNSVINSRLDEMSARMSQLERELYTKASVK